MICFLTEAFWVPPTALVKIGGQLWGLELAGGLKKLPAAFSVDLKEQHLALSEAFHGTESAEENFDRKRQGNPARRFGQPAEFGAVCAFLCSQHAGYLNAQNILLDGGSFPGTF